MKNLSGRLARKLQRSASLVNAGLSKHFQSVLDAAVVDRCDFVEICCSDALCLTEAMQQRGISASSLLRSDGVGNQTHRHVRSCLAGFLKNDLGRHGSHHPLLRIRTIRHIAVFEPDRFSDSFFRVCDSSLAIWRSQLQGMACKMCRLVFCRSA